jgi:hypothetical protein
MPSVRCYWLVHRTMNDHLVTVATFANPLHAEMAKNRLEAEGIPAFLADVESTLALLAGNLSSVKVAANERDARRATAILAALADESDAEPIRPLTEWMCPHCDTEIEPGFDVCWSCGNPLQALPGAFFAPKAAADAAFKESITRTLPPARPGSTSHGAEDELVQDSEETVQVHRAWRAAVLGLFLCPPLLHIYALWLLIPLARRWQYFESATKRRYLVAVTITVTVLAVALIMVGSVLMLASTGGRRPGL